MLTIWTWLRPNCHLTLSLCNHVSSLFHGHPRVAEPIHQRFLVSKELSRMVFLLVHSWGAPSTVMS